MKMTQTLLATALTLPLMFGGATVLASEGPNKHDRDGRGHHSKACNVKALLNTLELSDDQKEQLIAQRKGAKTARKNNTNEQASMHSKQRSTYLQSQLTLIAAAKFDEEAAQALADKMAQRQADRMVKKMAREHAILSVLTPKQKERYIALKATQQHHCNGPKRHHTPTAKQP